jgi:peptidoglycan hydrolase CwlO-like protein
VLTAAEIQEIKARDEADRKALEEAEAAALEAAAAQATQKGKPAAKDKNARPGSSKPEASSRPTTPLDVKAKIEAA